MTLQSAIINFHTISPLQVGVLAKLNFAVAALLGCQDFLPVTLFSHFLRSMQEFNS